MKNKDENKSNLILDAAAKLVLEQGLFGLSIAKVAKLVNISQSNIYIYFENKDDLLKKLYRSRKLRVFEIIREATQNPDTFVRDMIEAIVEDGKSHADDYLLINQFNSSPIMTTLRMNDESIANMIGDDNPISKPFVEAVAADRLRQTNPHLLASIAWQSAVSYMLASQLSPELIKGTTVEDVVAIVESAVSD